MTTIVNYPGNMIDRQIGHPKIQFGNNVPDGDADPWLSMPTGSMYIQIETNIRLWFKIADNSADADWVVGMSDNTGGMLNVALSELHKVVSNDIGQRVYNKVLKSVPVALESLREINSNDIAAISDTPLTSDPAGFGGLLATNTTPTLEYVNGDTDSEFRVLWASSNVDPVAFQLALPADLDASTDMTVSIRGVMGGATDTPTIALDTYFDTGDTKVEDATSAFSNSEGTVTATIAAADIPSGARTMTVELTPGTHGDDTLAIYWIEVQYYVSSTDPALTYANGDTDSSFALAWAAGETTPVVFQRALPPDLNDGENVTLHLRAAMGGSTDTLTLNIDTYFNEGDTKVEDSVATISGTTYAEYTITIAAADVPSGAQTITVELTPGSHATDSFTISALWLEYLRS